MYTWVIFLHVLSVLSFLLAHGGSAAVMFRVRAEREPARILALLDLSNGLSGITTSTTLLIMVTGIIGGFMGNWWGRGWIWMSLALLIGIGCVMSFLGRLYFGRVRRAVGGASHTDQEKKIEAPTMPLPEQLAATLNAGQPQLLAMVGLGGLAVITWLMIFKPF